MKKIILSLVAIATITLNSFGQAPDGFKYQAVVRNAGNVILNNQAVGMRMTIQQGSIGGATVYSETFTPTTNTYGLVNLEIGNGIVISGTFASIDWANGPFFIETAVDITGGTNYVVMGTSQLMSVPYALYAHTSGSSTPGPQGPAGTNGIDGATGAQGPQGIQGPAGNDGLDGAAGPMGPQGPAGTNGADGNDGLNGATGPMGPQGPAGNDGLDGATGPQGPIGATGLSAPLYNNILFAYGTGIITTSTTWQNVPGLVVTVTIPAGMTAKVLLYAETGLLTNCATNDAVSGTDIAIYRNGALLSNGGFKRVYLGDALIDLDGNNTWGNPTFQAIEVLTAGTYVYDLRCWQQLTGSCNATVSGPSGDIRQGMLSAQIIFQ